MSDNGTSRHSYVAAKQMFTLWPLIISQVALVVAPAFLAAEMYMIVGGSRLVVPELLTDGLRTKDA